MKQFRLTLMFAVLSASIMLSSCKKDTYDYPAPWPNTNTSGNTQNNQSNTDNIDNNQPNTDNNNPNTDQPISVNCILLDKESVTLKIDESVTLTATVSPDNATDKTVTWTTSDEAIATVDAEGKVTAIAIGDATITATTGEKNCYM